MAKGLPKAVANMAAATTTTKGPVLKAATVAAATAITGGDAPTEAEHNALVTKINAILTALKNAGLMA